MAPGHVRSPKSTWPTTRRNGSRPGDGRRSQGAGNQPVTGRRRPGTAGRRLIVEAPWTHRPPAGGRHPGTPAVGRDAALGGLGLHLFAQLPAAHGWTAEDGGRKVVEARVDLPGEGPPSAAPVIDTGPERLRASVPAADGQPLPTVLDHLMQMPDVRGGGTTRSSSGCAGRAPAAGGRRPGAPRRVAAPARSDPAPPGRRSGRGGVRASFPVAQRWISWACRPASATLPRRRSRSARTGPAHARAPRDRAPGRSQGPSPRGGPGRSGRTGRGSPARSRRRGAGPSGGDEAGCGIAGATPGTSVGGTGHIPSSAPLTCGWNVVRGTAGQVPQNVR